MLVEFFDKRVDPTGDDSCVVVEQHDVLSAGSIDTGGARPCEADIGRQMDDLESCDRVEGCRDFSSRRVVDEDDLDGGRVCGVLNRLQTTHDILEMVQCRDHDADPGRLARRQRDPRGAG